MLQSYTGFERELGLALSETAESLEQPVQLGVYQSLSELRALWRRMILNFRAAMIRFAGLPDSNPIAEEYNIEQIYSVIDAKLVQLQEADDAQYYGLQTESSLEYMRDYARQWHGYFQEVKTLRASGHWRGDIRFIEEELRPQQRAVEQTMDQLAQSVRNLSLATTQAVNKAAEQLNMLLWLMSGFGLLVIITLYILLNRSVLRPIARIANALAAEASGQQTIGLPHQRHREVASLISAFEHMRRQVQGRQQALEFQAVHDVLTGLPNRALLQDRLQQGLAAAQRHHSQLALLLLDLDRFKEINDTLGHQVGDRVLQEVAERLQTLLRDDDTAARLGGDEFALALPGMGRKEATRLAARIGGALEESLVIAGHSLYVSASIGIVTAPEEGSDPSTLIRRADHAMYSAKRRNRPYAFYDAKQDEEIAEGLTLANQLREALLTRQGLRLFYQPRFDPETSTICGAEALLRWHAPSGEWVSPERIVQVAEHNNLIRELTNWVLDTAIAACARCRDAGLTLDISANLSARDLQDRALPERVGEMLDRHGLPASQLILEITENAVLASPERARQVLMRLADKGVTLSIDDFGTGFSSLAHLKLLPVHELKIDKSFVLNMHSSENDAVIVRSTIDLGHNLGLKVVAEGVEDTQTLNLLRARRCDLIQGYLISRPVPLEELITQVRQAGGRQQRLITPAGGRSPATPPPSA
jgi:diguanylate cyclase (GGDEF)-like protein